MPGNTDLRRDESQPGLWVNAKWYPGTAGLFAVVIGVSRYSHLLGGEEQSPETYGLGQLAVSALTAFRVFEWLRDDYYIRDCPMAKCWILLSPTDAENKHEHQLASHTTPATFEECRLALGFWHEEGAGIPSAMQKIPVRCSSLVDMGLKSIKRNNCCSQVTTYVLPTTTRTRR